MVSEPNHELKNDDDHGCPVPWGQPSAYHQQHWQCPECGRWWRRSWELTSDQPAISEDQLLRRAGAAPGPPIPVRRHQLVTNSAAGLDYLIWVPDGMPGPEGWPMVVFLHGGAETGGDPSNAARGGLPREIEQGFEPAFVAVSPHCPIPPHPNRQSWLEFPNELDATVEQVRERYLIDPSAILLTGQSMGGFCTWHLGARSDTAFTALAPVCGGGDPRQAETLARLPICVFHGNQDPVVPIERASEMIDALRAHGGHVKAVIYPDASHVETAQRAYSPGSQLYDWFANCSHARAR